MKTTTGHVARYAAATRVEVERSQAQLLKLLRAHGAVGHGFASDPAQGIAVLVFDLGGRRIRLELRLPRAGDIYHDAEGQPPRGWKSWEEHERRDWCAEHQAQCERQRWRALLLIVRAKLELIAEGHSSVEREFLADIVLPGGERIHDALAPALRAAYEGRALGPLLPAHHPAN